MLLDPTTFEAMAEGLGQDAETLKTATAGMPALPPDDPRRPFIPERRQVLLSFGLTERDLDFMGAEQRAKVDEVIDHVIAVHAIA